MNDSGTLKDLVDAFGSGISKNNQLLVTLSIFVAVNILVALINLYLQIALKNKEKKIHSHNLKEVKRIETQESLYAKLEDLKYFTGEEPDEKSVYLEKIFDINRFVTRNALFLDKNIRKRTTVITDYFQSVIEDYSKKDIATEDKYFQAYIDEFNG